LIQNEKHGSMEKIWKKTIMLMKIMIATMMRIMTSDDDEDYDEEDSDDDDQEMSGKTN